MAEAGPAEAAADAAAAQPAAAGGAEQQQARLIVVERQYQQGVQAIRDNRLEDAVELFGQCLETRVAIYGDQAPECGGAYYRYGAALFYKAQDEADVFGDNLQDAAEKHDAQDDDPEPVDEAVPSGGAGPSGADGAGPSGMNAAEASAANSDGAEEGAAQEAEQTDMQLAWSMLEVAKLLFSRDRAANALDLADVHMLLGDLSSENDGFADALEDYRIALDLMDKHLPKGEKPPVRRLAELHYKASLALQFLHKAQPALEHTQTAVKLVQSSLAELKARAKGGGGPAAGPVAAAGPAAAVAPAPAASAAAAPASAAPAAPEAAAGPADASDTGAEAGGQAEAAAGSSKQEAPKSADAKEAEALKDSLEGLQERLADLQEIIAEETATRQQLRAAFASIAGASGAAPAAAAVAAADGTSGDSTAGLRIGTKPVAGTVRDLGIVGRGQKRIALAPVAAAPAGGAAASAAPGPAAADQPKRRRLDDLMGGGESSGFGGPAAAGQPQRPAADAAKPAAAAAMGGPATAAPAAAAASGGSATAALSAAAAEQPNDSAVPAANLSLATLPAFLQPAAVAATYGGSSTLSNGSGHSKPPPA